MSRKYPAPNSQIPYCDEYEQDHRIHGAVLDEIQREAEQELQYAERILSAADNFVAENRDVLRKECPPCCCMKRCKKLGTMRNMADQSPNRNFPQKIQDRNCTEFYNQQHRMPSPTPGPSQSYHNYDLGPQCPDNYQRSAPCPPNLSMRHEEEYPMMNANKMQEKNRGTRSVHCNPESRSSSPRGRQSIPCRRETCPAYKCEEDEDNTCTQFPNCDKKVVKRKTWPKKPPATHDELIQMIENEAEDVDLTLKLTAMEKRTYKKPCPKQQKAQMSVQHILQAHDSNKIDCLKEYGPLSDPDPEDISPELAASIMFAQEQGIKLDACPQDTIQHLFPEDKKVLSNIPGSTISVVDPKQGKNGDKEKLMERSSKISEKGASDSAYTKTMKNKGDSGGNNKPFETDTKDNGSKKEYVLVPQKPDRFNMIQVRGNAPTWFPGYFSSFPETPGIRLTDSPSKVFTRAWVLTNPGDVPASDIIVVD